MPVSFYLLEHIICMAMVFTEFFNAARWFDPYFKDYRRHDKKGGRNWFDSICEMEFPSFLADHSISFYKDLVDRNVVRKYSVGEILSTNKIGSNSSAILVVAGIHAYSITWKCSHRSHISMDISDQSGQITPGAIEAVAESIL
ncbi:hypothetical protein LIER_39143 [Lithospermum erythrorhizon]|uniref:Uncharacterized protein n=1 Tax=Lithospermum erythrorhizon TaxID=34254 RepID=A0AAV3QCJ6_LITER